MKYFKHVFVVLLLGSVLLLPSFAGATWFFDTETGAVFSGYNDIRIPGDTGTRFSFKDDLSTDPTWFVRLRAGTILADRHTISVLVAPLTLVAKGELDRDVTFDDGTFAKGETVRGTYRFDSYRLTYRYDFVFTDPVTFGAGLTGKIRDAAISLDGREFAEKPNTGFVPLVNLRLDWRFAPSWSLLLEADALAAPQGRAEDALLAIAARLNDRVVIRWGYRILEGGADNDEVYTFALFHYASFGLTAEF